MIDPRALHAAPVDPGSFHKSSFTANQGNCVELGQLPSIPAAIAVRDSWYPERTVLRGSKQDFHQLTKAVLTGRLTTA